MTGTAADILRARREAEAARRRVTETLGLVQHRLKPGTIAGSAWEGVRDKGTNLAEDAMEVVKTRPVVVSAVLGAFTLFLAREPLKSAASWLFTRRAAADEDLVTTRLDSGRSDGEEQRYDLTAPDAVPAQSEGVSA
jgi:hypothetical protein